MIIELILIILSLVLLIPQIIILLIRISQGKEDPSRFLEKLAIRKKPGLHNNVIWIHAASVGESNIALNLIEILSSQSNIQRSFLITTGTLASSNNVLQRIADSNNIIHQYAPIDNYFIIRIFLDYWRPQIAIFIESEIWPVTIWQSSNRVPVLIVNAIMSDKSFRRWKFLGFFAIWVGQKFSAILAQTQKDAQYFTSLGFKNVQKIGNLKYAQRKLAIDKALKDGVEQWLDAKKCIFILSTHKKDEELILPICSNLVRDDPNMKIIIAPRHPSRLNEVIHMCQKYNLSHTTRSTNILPSQESKIFIIDTIGEIHNICSIGIPTFVGGSFENGGHNILEPALYGSVILFGPDMSHCKEISEEFLSKKAAIQIKHPDNLSEQINYALNMDGVTRDKILQEARNIIQEKQNIVEHYRDKIEKMLQSYDH